MFRWLRIIAAVVGTLVLLAAATMAALVWLTLPGGDLTRRIPGLSAPVDINFDADGIPRIRAANDLDAAAALGFVHARDRMFADGPDAPRRLRPAVGARRPGDAAARPH